MIDTPTAIGARSMRSRWSRGAGGRSVGRRLAVALGVAFAAALAGCGGKTFTKQDVIAQANAICAGALRDVRATPPPANTSLRALTPYLAHILAVVEKEVASLSKLPRPATDRGLLDRWLAAEARSVSSYRALAAVARRGDRAATTQALAALGRSPAPGLARRYGAAQCGAAAGTSVS